ncbi:MAG: tetratricopeptide repeat protein [Deltaproteobacteria bacterium]|nr:tetratricopeptide repeat protein [Deltaproteobacteria bacterium]
MSGAAFRPSALALALAASLLVGGCASLGGGAAPAHEPVQIRPEAPPDYDFLVGRQFELDGQLDEASAAYERALAKDPDSAYLQRRLAELAARLGRYEEALAHAEQAHRIDPGDRPTRLFLGTLYRVRRDAAAAEGVLREPGGEPFDDDAAILLFSIYIEGDRLPEALVLAEWLVKTDPDGVRGYLALAGVHEKMGHGAQAERALRRALDVQPGNLSVYGALARLLHERGDRKREIAVYEEVLKLHPSHHATLVALSDAQLAEGQRDRAIATLEKILRAHPDDLRSVLRLGFLEYEADHYAKAVARFEKALAANPQQYEIAYYLGLVRVRAGDEVGAIAAFDRVPAEHERYAEARGQIAGILERRRDFAGAIAEVERARARAPSRPLDLYLATLRARAGDFDGAAAFLQGLLSESPGDDELLYNLGVLYGEQKRFDDSLRYMNLALEQNPDNASALNYLGYSWAEKGLNLDEAEEKIKRALELRPDDGFITDSLGWVYYMRARPLLERGNVKDGRALLRRAIHELEKAAQITGGDPVISEHLGDAYLLLPDKKRALEQYREAVRLEPRDGEQPDLRRKLEGLTRELESR